VSGWLDTPITLRGVLRALWWAGVAVFAVWWAVFALMLVYRGSALRERGASSR
jgi:hypothetical protein